MASMEEEFNNFLEAMSKPPTREEYNDLMVQYTELEMKHSALKQKLYQHLNTELRPYYTFGKGVTCLHGEDKHISVIVSYWYKHELGNDDRKRLADYAVREAMMQDKQVGEFRFAVPTHFTLNDMHENHPIDRCMTQALTAVWLKVAK